MAIAALLIGIGCAMYAADLIVYRVLSRRISANRWTGNPLGWMEFLSKLIPGVNVVYTIFDVRLMLAMAKQEKTDEPIVIRIGPIVFRYLEP